MDAPAVASLDGMIFDLAGSSASSVDAGAPTRFRYHEAPASGRAMLWGDYLGDTVVTGRFVGSRDGDRLTITFAHVDVRGELKQGNATSTIDRDERGRVRLTERFTVAGQEHISVCLEVRDDEPHG